MPSSLILPPRSSATTERRGVAQPDTGPDPALDAQSRSPHGDIAGDVLTDRPQRRKLPLRPAATNPLDEAFSGHRSRSLVPQRLSTSWTGPVVTAADLTESRERELLHRAGRDAILAAYGDFDPSAPPLILVHGIDGSGAHLGDLAERLRADGHQVFIAFYRDRGRATHDSGRALAQEMIALRQDHYSAGTPLDIVAHSMGGIVARAALNYLQDPGWLGEASDATPTPRAGFGAVRMRSIDTPWDGFAHEPDIPIIGPVIAWLTRLFMTLFGWLGAFDMRGNSDMFDQLFAPRLEGVDLQNHAARQAGESDSIRALPDLEPTELVEIARHVTGESGLPTSAHRARNAALALAQDARYSLLQRRLRTLLAAATPPVDDRARAAALVRAYEQTMPRSVGDHVGILRDDPHRDDLVDRLVRDLAT